MTLNESKFDTDGTLFLLLFVSFYFSFSSLRKKERRLTTFKISYPIFNKVEQPSDFSSLNFLSRRNS